MTSNWHRRFWTIFYLPFQLFLWSQSTWGISLYEVEHFDLSGSALGIWQLGFFFLSCVFVIDTSILSPLVPPALHFAAGQTVVGFVGLNPWNGMQPFFFDLLDSQRSLWIRESRFLVLILADLISYSVVSQWWLSLLKIWVDGETIILRA